MKPYISATTLKNKVSQVLNDVYFKGDERIVVRYGKPVAKIIPMKNENSSKIKLKEALDRSFGALPDFPDVTKFRRSRRKTITL